MKKILFVFLLILSMTIVFSCDGGVPDAAELTALTISEGTLTPAFASETTSYTATVGSDVASLTITATAEEDVAIQLYLNDNEKTKPASGEPSVELPMVEGDGNVIKVKVTNKQDAENTKEYTITVTKEAPQGTTLSALTLTDGTSDILNETFAPDTITYTADIDSAIETVNLTATLEDTNSTLEYNLNSGGETALTSGSEVQLAMNSGQNTIEVIVTNQQSDEKTYTITVTRAIDTALQLSNLQLTDESSTALTLDPDFNADISAYTTEIIDGQQEGVKVTASAADTNATMKLYLGDVFKYDLYNGVPADSITITQASQDLVVEVKNGTDTAEYVITVNKVQDVATDATLSDLELSCGILEDVFGDPVTFDPYTLNYYITVPNTTDTTTVTATAGGEPSVFELLNDNSKVEDLTSGVASSSVSLIEGTTPLAVYVKSQDGSQEKKYNIDVTRQAPLTGTELTVGSSHTETSSDNPCNYYFNATVGNDYTITFTDYSINDNLSYADIDIQILHPDQTPYTGFESPVEVDDTDPLTNVFTITAAESQVYITVDKDIPAAYFDVLVEAN